MDDNWVTSCATFTPLSWITLSKIVYSTDFLKGGDTAIHLQNQYKKLGP